MVILIMRLNKASYISDMPKILLVAFQTLLSPRKAAGSLTCVLAQRHSGTQGSQKRRLPIINARGLLLMTGFCCGDVKM